MEKDFKKKKATTFTQSYRVSTPQITCLSNKSSKWFVNSKRRTASYTPGRRLADVTGTPDNGKIHGDAKKKSPLIGETIEGVVGRRVAAALHEPRFFVLEESARNLPLLPAALAFVSYGWVLVRVRVKYRSKFVLGLRIAAALAGLGLGRRPAYLS